MCLCRQHVSEDLPGYNGFQFLKERVRECQNSIQYQFTATLGVSEHDSILPATRERSLIVLAELLVVQEYLRQREFFDLLRSEKFAYIHSGTVTLPDSYGIYHIDPTSPTGVVKVGGGPKTPVYEVLIKKAGRRVVASRSHG